MADFLFFQRIKPMVNMIECNAYFQREDERKYLEEQKIVMQAVTQFLEYAKQYEV